MDSNEFCPDGSDVVPGGMAAMDEILNVPAVDVTSAVISRNCSGYATSAGE